MSDLPIVAGLVKVDQDTELVLYVDSNDELIAASSPQYGDGEVAPFSDLGKVGAIVKLVDPCGNKLTVDLVRKFDVLNLRNTFVVRWAYKEETVSA